MEEETNDVADDENDLPTGGENRTTSNFVAAAIVALNQRALGEYEVECECGQSQRGEEAHPNEDRVSLNHTTVSDNRANESTGGIAPSTIAQLRMTRQGAMDLPEERDESDDSENDTSDDETNPSSRCDCHLVVFQDVRFCVHG